MIKLYIFITISAITFNLHAQSIINGLIWDNQTASSAQYMELLLNSCTDTIKYSIPVDLSDISITAESNCQYLYIPSGTSIKGITRINRNDGSSIFRPTTDGSTNYTPVDLDYHSQEDVIYMILKTFSISSHIAKYDFKTDDFTIIAPVNTIPYTHEKISALDEDRNLYYIIGQHLIIKNLYDMSEQIVTMKMDPEIAWGLYFDKDDNKLYGRGFDPINTLPSINSYDPVTGLFTNIIPYVNPSKSHSSLYDAENNKYILIYNHDPDLEFVSYDMVTGAVETSCIQNTSIQSFALNKCSFPAGMGETVKNKLDIYPNPVNDIMNIKANITGGIQLSIYNIIGELVEHKALDQLNSINVSGLSPGPYLIRISNEKEMIVRKFIKE